MQVFLFIHFPLRMTLPDTLPDQRIHLLLTLRLSHFNNNFMICLFSPENTGQRLGEVPAIELFRGKSVFPAPPEVILVLRQIKWGFVLQAQRRLILHTHIQRVHHHGLGLRRCCCSGAISEINVIFSKIIQCPASIPYLRAHIIPLGQQMKNTGDFFRSLPLVAIYGGMHAVCVHEHRYHENEGEEGQENEEVNQVTEAEEEYQVEGVYD